jgi:branched-chain amino acid transport system substrate-binding protein
MRITALAGFIAALAMSAAAQAQIAKDTIKIGVLADMSSLYADLGGPGSTEAAKMAVADFGGTIAGKKIEVVSADHQNKPDVGAAIARQWFDQDGVDMITDLTTSSVALAVQEVAREKNKVILINGAASSDLTGKNCAPTSVHWTYDTTALANGTGSAVVKAGGKTWFFITADYTFGHALESDTSAVVKAAGGKVLGDAKAPLDNADFSSMLITAQQSGADVIGLANGGNDTINAVKQASEFGISRGKQKIALLGANINDVHGMGLDIAQNLLVADAFYWDTDDATRAFAKRFYEKLHKMPNMLQAGLYSAVNHYLHAVQDAGTTDSAAVMQKMRDTPVNDFFAKNGHVRIDGMMVHDMHLYQVKTPAESKGEWDIYKLVSTVPGDEAFQPLSQSQCPLVKH